MDDNDRQEIFHQQNFDIQSMKMVMLLYSINSQCNGSIGILKLAIEEDRKNINNTIIEFKNRYNEIVRRLLYADEML